MINAFMGLSNSPSGFLLNLNWRISQSVKKANHFLFNRILNIIKTFIFNFTMAKHKYIIWMFFTLFSLSRICCDQIFSHCYLIHFVIVILLPIELPYKMNLKPFPFLFGFPTQWPFFFFFFSQAIKN